jgi:hypothetical protein
VPYALPSLTLFEQRRSPASAVENLKPIAESGIACGPALLGDQGIGRLPSGPGPHDISSVHRGIMTLPTRLGDNVSRKVRRRSAAWDTNDLEALLRRSAQLSLERSP